MAATHRKVIEYIADHTKVLKAIREIEQANERMGASLRRSFGRVTDVIGKDALKISQTRLIDPKTGQESIRAVENFGQTVKTSTGFVGTLNTTTTKLNGELRSSKTSFTESSKASASLTQNLANLAKRAALTIPIWLALRGAFMGSIRTIKDGISNIVEFDKALQKLKRNLQGTPQEIARNFQTAQRTITEFSLLTGKSTEEITRAIQRFATVGFDFETAMQAGLDATRLSVLLFGEAEETANAFARGLRALASNVEDTAKTQDEISRALALTSELWEVNAFELNELNGGFEKFAGTAKSMNFTIEETLTLLAALSTRGLNAERAGTLLRTSTQKLEQNLSKVARILGVEINPQMDRTFDVLTRVIDKIAELARRSPLALEANEALADAFGGIRSQDPARVLTALNKELKENLALTASVKEFEKDVEEVTDTLSRQAQIWRNLNREIGKALVTGLTGADNFLDGLKEINKFLKTAGPEAKKLGVGFSTVARTIVNIAQVLGSIDPNLRRFFGLETIKNIKDIGNAFKDLKNIVQSADLQKIDLEIEASPVLIREKEFTEKLKDAIESKDVNKISKLALNLDEIAPEVLSENSKNRWKKYLENLLTEIPIELSKTKTKLGEPELVDIDDFEKSLERVLDVQLDILKERGVTSSALLEITGKVKDQLGIEEDIAEVLNRELEIEKEINNERKLRKDLSSDTVKLFRIAQEHGSRTAQIIGDVLQGQTDFNLFVRRGGKELEIFKKEFGDIFEQQQAKSFFKGDIVPGAPGLRGGFQIPIDEEGIRDSTNQLSISIKRVIERVARRITEIEKSLELRTERLRTGRINLTTEIYRPRASIPSVPTPRVTRGTGRFGTLPGGEVQINIGDTQFYLSPTLSNREILDMVDKEFDKLQTAQKQHLMTEISKLLKTPGNPLYDATRDNIEKF